MRKSLAALFFALLMSAHAKAGRPLQPRELAEFLGSASSKEIAWTKSVGSDFDAYAGRALPPLSGTVNIYIGGWPHFKRDPAAKTLAGRLGMFPLNWHRKVAPDGTIRQEAALKLYDAWKVDVWLESKRQSDIDKMIALVSKLPTFTEKPKPVPR